MHGWVVQHSHLSLLSSLFNVTYPGIMIEDNDLAEYIRKTYASSGIQVESTGNTSLTCSLPPSVEGFSDLVLDLVQNHGATIDMESTETGTRLILWQDRSPRSRVSKHLVFILTAMIIVYILYTRGHAILNDISGLLDYYSIDAVG